MLCCCLSLGSRPYFAVTPTATSLAPCVFVFAAGSCGRGEHCVPSNLSCFPRPSSLIEKNERSPPFRGITAQSSCFRVFVIRYSLFPGLLPTFLPAEPPPLSHQSARKAPPIDRRSLTERQVSFRGRGRVSDLKSSRTPNFRLPRCAARRLECGTPRHWTQAGRSRLERCG